ncbi:hypothetical protein EsH8_V_000105 [Colletotrichum jinshuiense]
MSRMLYTTEDINGTIIPASAYILWPSSPLEVPVTDFSSNSTQWPMVAWAHGTSGGLQACAPSNYRNLQYHFQVPFTLALQGYVVVAPDYAGLGVGELPDGEVVGHPWAAFPAQANDIAHAITAARSAFPDYLKTDGPFVAMGHSQGGSAVWSFAERQVSKPIRGYRGAVAFAPPTDIINQARRARNYHAASVTKLWTNAFLSFQPPIIKGVTVAYPDMNLSGLTDVGRDRWVNVQEAVQGCLPTKQVSSFGVPLAETAHRNWTEHPSVLEFERRTAVGRRPFKGPLLILSGDVDSITDIENLRDVVRDTCRMEIIGNQTGLEFLEYKGQNHFPVIQASQGRWLAWINERFSSPTAKNTVSGSSSSSYNESIIYGSNGTTTITSNGTAPAVVVLDFGQNVEGIPTFEVVSASGDTSSFEISYGESRTAIDLYMSDGPLSLAAAADTYRVNQYNITGPSVISNRLIQGAFRYQKLNLSSPGTLKLKNIGVKPTTSTTPLTRLPGSFECSDEDLTRIWHTGARTVQLTEIPKNSIPDFLQVTNEGAYAESAAPQALSGTVAPQLLSYSLDLQAKPVKGGFGVSVLCDTLNSCIYISFDLVHHVVTAHAGSTALDTQLAMADLPTNITLGAWHAVHITADVTSIAVTLNSQPVLSLTQTARFFGSFGFGASFGHAAYFRNLTATTPAGEIIYTSPLTDESFLPDFLMGGNPVDTVVDGSRRDRIAYTGDLDVALGAAFASTFGTDFIDGSLELLGSYQALPGFFIPNAKIQQEPLKQPLEANMTGLIGYSFNFVNALAQNYEMRGNVTFAREWAPRIVRMLDWADSQTLPNGLFNISDASIGGDWNYYDPVQPGAVTKFNTVYAYSLQQSLELLQDAGVDVAGYRARLERLRAAINENLWGEDLGAYVMSDSFRTAFAQDANALAILAGVPASTSASSSILSTLAAGLALPSGPLAFSNATAEAGWAQKISPYASAYHLRAAFSVGDASSALTLLKTLWAPMADPKNGNYTGCFWETLNPDGTPGLGLPTSLCHGWSAGPTAELSRHILGVQPTAPGFTGWKVEPQTLGLQWAKGRYPTVIGDVGVDWRFENGLLRMKVESPATSKGVVYLPQPLVTPLERSVIRVNGIVTNGTQFDVKGGDVFVLTQEHCE